jgi:hypothetical protein
MLQPVPKGPPNREAKFEPPVQVGRVVVDGLRFYHEFVRLDWHLREPPAHETMDDLRASAQVFRGVMPIELVDDQGTRAAHKRTGGPVVCESELFPPLASDTAWVVITADGHTEKVLLDDPTAA